MKHKFCCCFIGFPRILINQCLNKLALMRETFFTGTKNYEHICHHWSPLCSVMQLEMCLMY